MNTITQQPLPASEENDQMEQSAYLIIGDVKVFPLDKPVVNIGRSLESQLVIDAELVSRNHAQIRLVKGEFIIFDLASTGGTFVNGERVNRAVLSPGDVISLASPGIALIFGTDNPPPRPDLNETAKIL